MVSTKRPPTPHEQKMAAYLSKAPARTARERMLFAQLGFVASVAEAWEKVCVEKERPIVVSVANAVSLDNPKFRKLFEETWIRKTMAWFGRLGRGRRGLRRQVSRTTPDS